MISVSVEFSLSSVATALENQTLSICSPNSSISPIRIWFHAVFSSIVSNPLPISKIPISLLLEIILDSAVLGLPF